MKIMESTNDELLLTVKDLRDAQRIAAMDLQMAINVQSSFFPKNAPESEEWEIAFLFKPMAGVSGDLYDFYIVEDQLTGIGLFDVSGHGIASGLITMIAKSIIFRNFSYFQKKSLNEILKNINNELIDEIEDVDNYLTGIMLRFNKECNEIEYVNAGHTDLLKRKNNTGKVSVIEKEEGNFKGHFLGVPFMNEEFELIQFPMEKEDSILIFTDCLNESKNIDNQEFGISCIKSVYESISPDSSAKEQLENIMREFYTYIDKEKSQDDLTVINIKKLR